MNFVRVYVYLGKVVIPKVVRSAQGMFVDHEPLKVIDCSAVNQIKEAVSLAWSQGVGLADEGQESYDPEAEEQSPESIIAAAVGLNRWDKFERNAVLYSLYSGKDSIQLLSTGRAENGMWSKSGGLALEFDPQTKPEILAEYLVDDIVNLPEAKPEPPVKLLTTGLRATKSEMPEGPKQEH
jgi:hypothetical protein